MIQYLQYMIKFIKLEFSLMIDILNLILFFFKIFFLQNYIIDIIIYNRYIIYKKH